MKIAVIHANITLHEQLNNDFLRRYFVFCLLQSVCAHKSSNSIEWWLVKFLNPIPIHINIKYLYLFAIRLSNPKHATDYSRTLQEDKEPSRAQFNKSPQRTERSKTKKKRKKKKRNETFLLISSSLRIQLARESKVIQVENKSKVEVSLFHRFVSVCVDDGVQCSVFSVHMMRHNNWHTKLRRWVVVMIQIEWLDKYQICNWYQTIL